MITLALFCITANGCGKVGNGKKAMTDSQQIALKKISGKNGGLTQKKK